MAVNCFVPFGWTVADVGEIEIPTAGTVTVAVAVFVVSAWLCAWTVSDSWAFGAMNRPEALMFPEPLITDQFTPVLLLPETVAVNCCCPPWFTVADVGEMEIETLDDTVTAAVALFVVSAWLCAWTVSVSCTFGAVNKPDVLTVPVPFITDQVTPVFVVPETVAVNCLCAPGVSVAEVGDIETATAGTATVAVAVFVVSAWLCACTVSVSCALGAVKIPAALIVPVP